MNSAARDFAQSNIALRSAYCASIPFMCAPKISDSSCGSPSDSPRRHSSTALVTIAYNNPWSMYDSSCIMHNVTRNNRSWSWPSRNSFRLGSNNTRKDPTKSHHTVRLLAPLSPKNYRSVKTHSPREAKRRTGTSGVNSMRGTWLVCCLCVLFEFFFSFEEHLTRWTNICSLERTIHQGLVTDG